MFRNKLFEPTGYIIAVATFLFSFILFYNNTDVFGGSIAAALLSAALVWMTYLMLRLVLLTFRS